MFLQNFVLLFLFCLLLAKYGECDVFGSFDLDKSKTFGIDEVRCYCNMAECITTGYMCKSQKLGCFSDLAAVTSPSSIEMVTHGCLDLLDKSLQTTCRNLPAKSDSSSSPLDSGAPKSLLLCCSEDMCNDVDIPSNRMDSSNQVFNISDPLFTDKTSAGRLRRPNLTFTTELFFRLATFAVPVLGAMILFMLVTLAIKLLRSDANEDRMVAMKLRQNDAACLLLNKTHFPNSSGSVNDFEASSKKIPLLYQYDRTHLPPGSYLGNRVNLLYPVLPGGQQQHVEKNKTNAKLNNFSATYNTPGSNLDQPLLKINSGTHSQQANCNTFGAMPWGAGVLNNLGQNICPDAANVSAALNQFVSNVSTCQLSAPQNVSDNLSSSSVHLGKSAPCCSAGPNVGNVDGAIPTTSDTTLENPPATLESDGATCSENLRNVSAIDGATTIDSSTTNHANFLNVPATNHGIASTNDAASDTTSRNIAATSGNVSATSRIGAETCCDHLETSKLNLQCAAPCNISSPQGSHTTLDPRMSTNSAVSSQKHNAFPCSASSLLGVNAANTPIPVFGPFACITTQASSDEHPIFSLQKSSEHPICNKLQLSCDCFSGCSNKCFEKTFSSSHGCNLCQNVDGNERLIASNGTTAACNNFDSEDDTKLNYKKNLMPSFCTN